MPKSKTPKVKRPAANPVSKPTWYQELNGAAKPRRGRPMKSGAKAQNKGA